ncbi:MAG TPA: VPLPA-CTERM sorting domain-containing protein [Gammaproteobacteria bacterium]|nr:VPLPA-CTERM sorting domain-containing protein [Gammaproteobacteria bacterium]
MIRSSLKIAFYTSFSLLGIYLSQAHAVAVSGQGSWETTLQARDLDGNTSTAEAYYDTVLGITWLAEADYGAVIGFDDGDPDTFANSMYWATALSTVSGLDLWGYDQWRLPDTSPINGAAFNLAETNDGTTDIGYNISAPGTLYEYSTASELAYMFFHTLGNLSFLDTSGTPLASGYGVTNSGPFSGLFDYFWWSGQGPFVLPEDPGTDRALGFGFATGRQRAIDAVRGGLLWAVHPGDIGTAAIITSPVPIPAAVWLFASGLLGLVGIARRGELV